MDTDRIARAFAAWTEAHKRHVDGERRLGIAARTAAQMGMLPPDELVAEVKALRADADRLLAAAEAEMRAAQRR